MSEGAIAEFDNSRRLVNEKKDKAQSQSKGGQNPPGTIPIPFTDRYINPKALTISGVASSGAGLVLLAATALGGGGDKAYANDYDIKPIPPTSDSLGNGEAGKFPIYEIRKSENEYISESVRSIFKNLTPEEEKIVNIKVKEKLDELKGSTTGADVMRILQYDGIIGKAANKYSYPKNVARGLAFAESKGIFDNESHAGARGPWQLMPETAREMGLIVDLEAGIDERDDPVASTEAALKYLARMRDRAFGKSGLEILAYNWGWGHTQDAVAKSGLAGNRLNIEAVINKTPEMPDEAKNYAFWVAASSALINFYEDSNLR